MRKRWNFSFLIFILLAVCFAIGLLEGTLLEPKFLAASSIIVLIALLLSIYTHPYRIFVLKMESNGFVKEDEFRRCRQVGEREVCFEGARGSLIRPMHRSNYTFLFTGETKIPASILSEETTKRLGVGPLKISIGHAFSYSGKDAVKAMQRIANENAAEAARDLFTIGAVRRIYARGEDRGMVVEVVGGSALHYYVLEQEDLEVISNFFSALDRAWSKHRS